MRRQQRVAKRIRQAEEAREELRKHVVMAHREPFLERAGLIVLARFRHAPEPALLQETKLVVVVEDRAPSARDAEVLEQEIARKNVAARKILDLELAVGVTSRITSIQEFATGDTLGYNRTFTAKRRTPG